MGYRFNDTPPDPEDMLRKFPVRNGAEARITFACYYLQGHNPKHHDFIGWPEPRRVDGICQDTGNLKLFGLKQKDVELETIDLEEEGYDRAIVAYETTEHYNHVVTSAEIQGNLIRMKAKANLPEFTGKPVDIKFTVFVKKSSDSTVDAACHGVLSILPGPPCPE